MLMDLEAALVDRLGEIAALRGVYGAADFGDLAKAGKGMPCAYVLYGGYSVTRNSDDGLQAQVEERWLVVLSIKHAGRAGAGPDPLRSAASPLIRAVVDALLGWTPGERGYQQLRLDSAPRPEYAAGHLLFPIAFRIAHVVRATI